MCTCVLVHVLSFPKIRCKVRVGAMSGNHHESDRSEN